MRKTRKKNISQSEKYMFPAFFQKQNSGLIQVNVIFPALVLQRANLKTDHILLKKPKQL